MISYDSLEFVKLIIERMRTTFDIHVYIWMGRLFCTSNFHSTAMSAFSTNKNWKSSRKLVYSSILKYELVISNLLQTVFSNYENKLCVEKYIFCFISSYNIYVLINKEYVAWEIVMHMIKLYFKYMEYLIQYFRNQKNLFLKTFL